jgi:hypothetical protein
LFDFELLVQHKVDVPLVDAIIVVPHASLSFGYLSRMIRLPVCVTDRIGRLDACAII